MKKILSTVIALSMAQIALANKPVGRGAKGIENPVERSRESVTSTIKATAKGIRTTTMDKSVSEALFGKNEELAGKRVAAIEVLSEKDMEMAAHLRSLATFVRGERDSNTIKVARNITLQLIEVSSKKSITSPEVQFLKELTANFVSYKGDVSTALKATDSRFPIKNLSLNEGLNTIPALTERLREDCK
ncbi:MAG TPA: hypothetical protein PLJ21_08080 [Pseudobdellovibrionaceae bacterium]|nr:hypothetical protein [Pseudobdellovibrionaceae bacterium]